MAVITISRQYGSGGGEIADRVCEILGYRHFDKHQLDQAAEEAGLPKHTAVDYSEDNHEVQTFLDRLFGRTASVVQKIAWSEDPSLASSPEKVDLYDTAVLGLVRRAIQAAWRAGDMLIVGRGGQVLLKDFPATLHVRIEAPLEERIQRVKAHMKQEQQDFRADIEIRRAAQDLITSRDTASADYIKRFYNVDWADPMLYHLIINTGKLTIEQASQTIVEIARTMQEEPVKA